MKHYRCCILLLISIVWIPRADLWAQPRSLGVEIEKNSLVLSAGQLHFLTDKELEKLHNGLTVTLILEVTVAEENTSKPRYRKQERFAFSFDLWEEKYSVYLSPPSGRFISHISAEAAEKWCLENMPVPLDIVSDRNAFMVQLEGFIEEDQEENNREESSGLSLESLIEFFSLKKDEQISHWKVSTNLLRLNDLKQANKGR